MRHPVPFSWCLGHLLASSATFRAAVVMVALAVLSPVPVPVATAQDADDPGTLRAHPPTWIFDHRSRQGVRVTDEITVSTTTTRTADIRQFMTPDPVGYSPAQIRRAYRFDQVDSDGAGQIIAIPNAFDYPDAAADLKVFIATFGLTMMYGLPGRPSCTVAAGPHPCFEVVYARGVQPELDDLWALESCLDIQWAHAIAPGADILLVEASSNNFIDLFQAVQVATTLGATVVSMSWGGVEFANQSIFEPLFNLPGITFIAGSGDSGNPGLLYPAASPQVIGVGGTRLPLSRHGNRNGPETAWVGSGGGISQFMAEPTYQATYPIPFTGGYRGVPDVAYNADPDTGFSVYDSRPILGGWVVVGGTSAASPQWAGLIALANALRTNGNLSSNNLLSSPLYEAASDDYRRNYFDIKSGSNGNCGPVCTATRGYDFVTGLGSPKADRLIEALVAQ